MARLVISGYYGLGNAGDEAVLAAMLTALRHRAPGIGLTILSADPERTREVHGVEAVERADLAAVSRALAGADLLVSGGGSLLQDVTSLRSLLYYLGVMVLARARGVPVFFYAQGIGPFRRPVSRWLVARAAERAAGITVRDQESANLLRQSGVRRNPIRVTADPVFAWADGASPGASQVGGQQAGDSPAPAPPAFGFAFRPWPGEEVWVGEVGRAAGQLAERYGARIRWLSFQPDRDLPLARRLQAACPSSSEVVEPAGTPDQVFAQVAATDLVVASRLHALIMGVVSGRPVVGVSYDPKVDALLSELDRPVAGRLPGLTAEELVRAVGEAWEQREAVLAAQAPRVAELARRAGETADLALACLGSRASARVEVLGVGVDPVTIDEAATRIGKWVREARTAMGSGGKPVRQVVTLNPEMVVNAGRNSAFASLVRQADLVTADGVGVLWAARRSGAPIPGRVTGIDLVNELLRQGTREGWGFFFLGAAPGVAEEAARRAVDYYPGLRVVGTHHGYFPEAETGQVVAEVRALAPDILLVALGSPKQEEFIARHRESLQSGVALGVGGVLDVLAGRTRRAPRLFRKLGLEWLYRLAREPRRLGRTLVIPAFVWQVLRRPRR